MVASRPVEKGRHSASCRCPPPHCFSGRRPGRRGHESRTATALPQRVVRQSGGSNVGCSHAAGCPLFPLLKASLQGWREYYCDSADQWLGCARYQMSLTGERVPISLLPNGASARHLEAPAEAGRSSATSAAADPRQSPPPRPTPGSPEPASWPQPAPTRPHEQSQSWPGTATPEAMAQFGATPPPADVWHDRPSPPPQVHRPSDSLARQSRRAPDPKRGWWARFADWMRGPA